MAVNEQSAAGSGIVVRRAEDRGVTERRWLRSRHSFSFGGYHDPERMGFGPLRVINDDVVAPGAGFSEHGHADMEIMTWVLDGVLEHGDSLGNLRRLRPGEVQVMSAGRGIIHRELNGSATEAAHFLQVWIEPARRGIEPRYDQRAFDAAGRANRWQTLASGRAEAGAMPIEQDAAMGVSVLDAGATIDLVVDDGRRGYLHVARGRVEVAGVTLVGGDAIAVDQPVRLTVAAAEVSELLAFDLP